jgi:phosphoglycerate dehydrogenase-like enzyme
MTGMKVLLTKSFVQDDLDYISERLLKGIALVRPVSFDEEAILTLANDADIFLGSYITERLLVSAKRLKFIQIPWTGVDNLDFDLLIKHKITVCNSHSNSMAVAEHAVAMMMDAAKKVSYHDRLLRKGKWNRINNTEINEISPFSVMISNSKVGIIGFGAIGKAIFRLLKGFNCSFKVFTKENGSTTEKENYLQIYSPSKLIDKVDDLDFVFVAVPLTPETNCMINNTFLSSMSPRTILINISRGEVINEEDFYYAIKNKTIAFAAIDTWFNYPTRDNPEVFPSARFNFHLLDNIVLSPHRAGYVREGFPHLDDAIENLNRFYLGKPLINVVSLKDRY